jgi:cytochrome c biogenesis protein CcmG/thiol:disulfide interchange protein DsbE
MMFSSVRRGVLVLVLLLAALGIFVLAASGGSSPLRASGAAFAPDLDPGTKLPGVAPAFTLTDQFGARVSLRSFRGRVVILAFNDSECTTVCPLTTTAMVTAKRLLGPAGSRVALLGIDANPTATSIADVRAYSEVHGMTRAWRFLTGSSAQLRRVWKAYHIEVAIQHGQIDHTPALFVIDPAGRFAKVYLTQMSYSSIGQQAQLLAQEAASLLPAHPHVLARLSYAQIPAIQPTASVTLPAADGGSERLGPGRPRLLLFFATWDSEVTDLARALEELRGYQSFASSHGLPALAAVDEATVEPNAGALPRFLSRLRTPLNYAVAVDRTGRIADGYGVQDEPWLLLISRSGNIVWYDDVATGGWLSTSALVHQVRAALARGGPIPSAAQAARMLAGSPAPLAALHAQAGRLLGDEPALRARLRALRGYPVVINAWASWCGPCRAEFGLLASAAARYGRTVAFLGVDTTDSPGNARAFLAVHPVSYPSYQANETNELSSLAVIEGLPTTIYINRSGKVVYVHTGQYKSQGTLDSDIASYAPG